MKKLILRCGLSPGDIVMLTAAVRDLHRCYPGRFATDVRTSCAELWEHNPYLTAIADDDAEAETLDCSYPLIDRSNTAPYHCLHGFIEFLNERLGLAIKPTEFRGDIHLSDQEMAWYSQVHELTGEDTPFWVVCAGGKYDVTVKWWDPARYQEVVNRLAGRVVFVQIGQSGHHHPPLRNVIDLRGRTTLRELVRLVYHADGVLCSVTALMHLAAAVPAKQTCRPLRPGVVVAGGREPAHWEAYPGHQFLHTVGALPCCADGGCWKDRGIRLRDGDKRDLPQNRCDDMVGALPRCMEMIEAAEVVRRIEIYYSAGVLKYLSPAQLEAARSGIKRSAGNDFDTQPLNLHSAGLACDQFLGRIPAYPGTYYGRGVVMCVGGIRYFTCAWVCVKRLRALGCDLPVQFWYLGDKELPEELRLMVAPLNVECIDALRLRARNPVRVLNGWELKAYAILHSKFEQVLLLDADNVPTANPEFLFNTPEFRSTGALFWPDYPKESSPERRKIWRSCGLTPPREPEFESGQVLVDKRRVWPALCLSMWFNENSDFYYRYMHGDKETFHLAFRKLKMPYSLVPHPVEPLPGVMCQHDFSGRRIFQHRNTDKWDLFHYNRQVEGFRDEAHCREHVAELRAVLAGKPAHNGNGIGHLEVPEGGPPEVYAVMISCPERAGVLSRTLNNLSGTDWADAPVHVQIDDGKGKDHRERQTRCAYKALEHAYAQGADYILFLEDDLEFNAHFRHNLRHCRPIFRSGGMASLYNPGLTEHACDLNGRVRFIKPRVAFGSQALVIPRGVVQHFLENWDDVAGMQDVKVFRLFERLKAPLMYHAPSLVQHVGSKSVWGGGFHEARDFDPEWRA